MSNPMSGFQLRAWCCANTAVCSMRAGVTCGHVRSQQSQPSDSGRTDSAFSPCRQPKPAPDAAFRATPMRPVPLRSISTSLHRAQLALIGDAGKGIRDAEDGTTSIGSHRQKRRTSVRAFLVLRLCRTRRRFKQALPRRNLPRSCERSCRGHASVHCQGQRNDESVRRLVGKWSRGRQCNVWQDQHHGPLLGPYSSPHP